MRNKEHKTKSAKEALSLQDTLQSSAFPKEMFDILIQHTPVSVYVLEDWSFTYVNHHFCELTGFTEEELIGSSTALNQLIHPEDLPQVQESITNRIQDREANARYRVRALKKDRTLKHIEIHASKIVRNGKAMIFGTVIDITEEVLAQLQLQENRERFKSLFYNNPDAIFTFDFQGKFIDANPGCEKLSGYSTSELLDMSFTPLILSEDLPKAIRYFKAATEGITNSYELAITRKDGQIRYLEVTSFPMKAYGKIVGAYGIAKDITAKIEYKQRMEDLAFYDPLTKLPNRKLFEDRLNQVIEWTKEKGTPAAVLFLDLDRFKFINDSLGHHLGDEFLKLVSVRLMNCLRKTDTVGRIAGDEFAVLLPNTEEKDAVSLAIRLNEAIAKPFNINGHSVSVSASIGIALMDGAEVSVMDVLKRADTAMYYSKKYGSSRYTIYSKELDIEATYKLTIEKDLIHTIRTEGFELYYQPIVNLATGNLNAMEALMRWNHPELGFVPPDQFIPIAEESGQIIQIGKWVLQTACAQNKKWQDDGYLPFKMCVNISTIELQHPNFVEMVQTVLEETGLEAKWLELEVTESILMEDTKVLKESLTKLKSLGVSISIDDFGTGYTSLSYLRQFSFDRVKIDRCFIDDISHELNGKAITSTIITLAHKLNMGVIAEGIEDSFQLDFLQGEACDEGQGYYFSRPLPPDQLKLPIYKEQ